MNKFSLNQRGKLIRYVCSIAFLFHCVTSQAIQQQSQQPITGTVKDAQGILPGVTVLIKGKALGTTTDENGQFSINANPSDVLVFSYIGYKTVEITVANQTAINIQLEEDTTQLKEIVLNAGYYSVKDKERTGSISRITAKDIETQPVTNVLATMQGRMPGVNITQTTGISGGNFAIQVRGQNSVRTTGNDPLYVIDGIPYASESIGSFSTAGILSGTTSPLNSINPDNIESIEVLKDADATAIYGSRGANGVVLITTKKGKVGKTKFTGNLTNGYGGVTQFMKLMNTEQYLTMRREAFENDGIVNYPANAYDLNGAWDQNRYTDWQEELIGGTAQFTNINSSISGGNAQTQFLLSGNFAKETTVFPGDFRYKKGNIHANANHVSTNNKFSVQFSAGYTVQDNNQPYRDLTRESRILAPTAPALYNEDGDLNWQNNTFSNPLGHLNGKYNALTNDLIANTVLSYNVFEEVQIKSSFGFSQLNHQESTTAPSTIYNPAFGIGSDNSVLFLNNAKRRSWIIEPQINWQKSLNSVDLSFLAGATFQDNTASQTVFQALGFPSNSLINNLGAASNVSITQNDNSEYRYQAFFARANMNWNDKYILNITGRRDGSSRFGPGKQFATFGAVGAAWLFHNENFLKDSKIISFGKLRASYGITGNDQIGNYQFLNTYTTTGVAYNGIIGLEPSRLYNSNFGWESNKKFEVALETNFLNDKIALSVGWYKNQSSNQLVGIPLPGTTGFASLQANLDATVVNQGIEISLYTENIKNKNFSWSTSVNFTQAKNKLKSFPSLEASTYRNQFVLGQPLNIVKVYNYLGINPETGIYQFEDVNDDGVINDLDKQTVKDLNPQFFGGIQNQLKFKQVQLDFLFQFVKQENYNALKTFTMPGTLNNQLAENVDRWQNEDDTAQFQLYSVNNAAARNAYTNYTQSNASISDASYIRLKNIALYYTIPEEWTKKVQCRISLTGQNLLTFTKFKGADPEFKIQDRLPPLKIITTGLEITF
jgi:TonB-linked SusC/RagA family outer membrane protein